MNSFVNFPTSEPAGKPAQPTPRPPHLPFRRISLPTAPSLTQRDSIVSVASFDSLPEEDAFHGTPSGAFTKSKHRGEGPRKSHKRAKPVDEAREAKRRKVIDEFYQTERAYVDGLELIYTHFLAPIIASLDTGAPLLDRSSLTAVFSNFIDIWNLHRSFFSALTALLPTDSPSTNPPPLSPILLSHFPYLSLYTPFVTSFPSVITTLSNLTTPPAGISNDGVYNSAFATFLATQEADPRCGKLKLRDWLLTIVQRCPRYLLLLKDLISCTGTDDEEHAQLTAVHALVSKITLSLNTSLHTHSQTLALLALQRATPNLPFQLIVPGRSLIRRGPLLQIEQSNQPQEREFLLFSDCLVWLAGEESERMWKVGWSSSAFSPVVPSSPGRRIPMIRARSKSEAELSMVRARDAMGDRSPSRPKSSAKIPYLHPAPSGIKRMGSSNDERWIYKGRAELVDLEVVISSTHEEGEERRFEILSPHGSFVLYSGSEEERDQWASDIRQAKAQILVSLNVMHPNSTLTSSASNNHIRQSLQALPFHPSDERIATIRASSGQRKSLGKGKRRAGPVERRGKVEHWVPAIWIPDEKTEGCMRCGKPFGWRRRRHHCRLCGRCVCAGCSERTFFISDPNLKNSSKPARACNACYEAVFPLIEDHPTTGQYVDSVNTLTHVPQLVSLPTGPSSSTPQALMALDSPLHRQERSDNPAAGERSDRVERVRLRTPSRPRSYHQILEDFGAEHRSQEELEPVHESHESSEPSTVRRGEEGNVVDLTSSPPSTPPLRNENTARRHQRFSVPAVALQTTSVMAHTISSPDSESGDTLPPLAGRRRSKRFSLVLGRSSSHSQDPSGKRQQEASEMPSAKSEFNSVAVGRLSELLSRKKA
ncbi:FYVE-type domain-containing protein [Pleurotus pulmonarius]